MASPAPRGERPRRPLRPLGRVSLAEYLAFERRHPMRHEYVDGYVYAMAGARLRHNSIIGNMLRVLFGPADASGCRVYFEAAKVQVGPDVFYPDVIVTCEPEGDAEADIAYAPCVLVEVLSPSTAKIDRSLKLMKYRALPSLRAYLIVSQRDRHVERHWRDAADAPWQMEEVADAGTIPLPCPVPMTLTLDQVYRGLTFGPRLRRVREGAPPARPEPAPV